MVEAKFGDDIIVSKIRTSACKFDTSIDDILKLKTAGVSDPVIQAMVEAAGAAKSQTKDPPPNPNDPKSPHDPGIYWFAKEKRDNQPHMVPLEPSVYSGAKTGGIFKSAMTYGIAKAQWKAVVREGKAALRISEPSPEFWFYFEERSHGLSSSGFASTGASSPNEFILEKMEGKGKEREVVVGEMNAFGASTGARSKDVVNITFVKTGPGVYKVAPLNPLPAGEYCFFYAGANMAMGQSGGKLFDFVVDGGE